MLETPERIEVSEIPPGYRMTELGPLPEEWRVVRLGDTASVRGETISPENRLDLRYVGLEHLDSGNPRILRWGTPETVRSAKSLFYPGDILYGKLRPYLDKSALAESKGMCSTDILVLRPGEEVDVAFLTYMLHTKAFVAYAISTTTGVNHPRTSWQALSRFPLPLPPLPEQRAIAYVLSTVQQAKESTEAVIAATRELKKSLMRHVFTYGPVPVDQVVDAAVRETRVGVIPASWPVESLGSCAVVQTGLAKGRKLQGNLGPVPYLRVANVQDGHLDLSEIMEIEVQPSDLGRYGLRPGDVLLTEGGDFDKLGRGFIWGGQIEPCLHQNHIFAVRPDRDRLLPEYLAFLAQSHLGKGYFLSVAHQTTHLACINSTKLRQWPVPVAPIEDQEAIGSKLASIDSKLRVEEARRQAFRSLLDTLSRALLSRGKRVS